MYIRCHITNDSKTVTLVHGHLITTIDFPLRFDTNMSDASDVVQNQFAIARQMAVNFINAAEEYNFTIEIDLGPNTLSQTVNIYKTNSKLIIY